MRLAYAGGERPPAQPGAGRVAGPVGDAAARADTRGASGPATMASAGLGQDGGAGADAAGPGAGVGSPGNGAARVGSVVAGSPGNSGMSHAGGAPVVGMTRPRTAQKHGTRGGTGSVVTPGAGHSLGTREALTELLSDRSATGQARAAAARTLAEMDGLIGRHQSRPDRDAAVPVEELTRAGLVAELARLRARCSPSPG